MSLIIKITDSSMTAVERSEVDEEWIESCRRLDDNDDRWSRRRTFLREYFGKYEKKRLQCLSMILVNVKDLGCKYDKSLMTQVKAMGTAAGHEECRKEVKLATTFRDILNLNAVAEKEDVATKEEKPEQCPKAVVVENKEEAPKKKEQPVQKKEQKSSTKKKQTKKKNKKKGKKK